MSLFKRVVSQQIEFFLVVDRPGPLDDVPLHVLFADRDALLHVLANQASCCVRVGCCEMADAKIEFEPFRDGGLQRRNALQQIHRLRPRRGVRVMNQ